MSYGKKRYGIMFSAFTVENQAPDFACTHRRQGSLKMAEAAGVLFLGFLNLFPCVTFWQGETSY